MNDILVSKIVGSPTETSWSQASSTGKLYIVIGLSSESENSIISKGKNILEQIQREFFAIDNKNLYEIKSAVEKVFSSVEKGISYSAVVGAIKDDILYVITASTGIVLIERNNNLAEVVRGEEGKIIGFSGRLKDDDIIILQTEGFNKKISNKLLAEYTGTHDSQKLAEDLAPFILEDSRGEEAAIIVNYKNPHASYTSASRIESKQPLQKTWEDEKSEDVSPSEYESDTKNIRPNPLNLIAGKFKNVSRKQKGIMIFAILILILILGSLFAERYIEQRRVAGEEFSVVYEEASQKLESAQGLSSLNRGRALEEVNEAIVSIEQNLDKFPEGSDEYNKLNKLLSDLKALQEELGGGSQLAGNSIFSAQDSETIGTLNGISISEDRLIAVGDTGFAVLNSDGEIEGEEEFEEIDIRRVISDDSSIYILSDDVYRTTISNGNTSSIISDTSDALDISYFGSNLYLLKNGGEGVKKYSGSSFTESDYFTEDVDFDGNPISFGIDSSIYVLSDSGNIQKFTRGTLDNEFKLDSSVRISKNALLYANENLSNIYALDIDNASIIQIGNTGSANKKFNSLELQNAKSFTVSSDESKVYVVIDDQVYSYDL